MDVWHAAPAELAANWLDETSKSDGDWLGFYEEVYTNPELVWATVSIILDNKLTDKQMSILAAGVLEALLDRHGDAFIERFEQRASQDEQFRTLLGGIWQSSIAPEIWNRILVIRAKAW